MTTKKHLLRNSRMFSTLVSIICFSFQFSHSVEARKSSPLDYYHASIGKQENYYHAENIDHWKGRNSTSENATSQSSSPVPPENNNLNKTKNAIIKKVGGLASKLRKAGDIRAEILRSSEKAMKYADKFEIAEFKATKILSSFRDVLDTDDPTSLDLHTALDVVQEYKEHSGATDDKMPPQLFRQQNTVGCWIRSANNKTEDLDNSKDNLVNTVFSFAGDLSRALIVSKIFDRMKTLDGLISDLLITGAEYQNVCETAHRRAIIASTVISVILVNMSN